MMNAVVSFVLFIMILVPVGNTLAASQHDGDNANVSGKLVEGYRILQIRSDLSQQHLRVFRGDYIKFDLGGTQSGALLKIPALSIEKQLSGTLKNAPFFKMKTTGVFAYTLGGVSGNIEVVAYRQSPYAEVTAAEAAAMIQTNAPLVLDVRTPGEFQMARLDNAVLVPVQTLQQRFSELTAYKDKEILIYCATGNRSTVASKILVDKGFKRIYNLRYGIVDWYQRKYPIVR